MASDYGPEFDEFAKHVREELIPKIDDCLFTLSIIPSGEVDVKFAMELGVSIMLDKPIVAIVAPGTKVSEKLAKVVDRFVELDLNDPQGRERLAKVVKEIVDKGVS